MSWKCCAGVTFYLVVVIVTGVLVGAGLGILLSFYFTPPPLWLKTLLLIAIGLMELCLLPGYARALYFKCVSA